MTREEIITTLQAHNVKRHWPETNRMRCKCGTIHTAENTTQLYLQHRQHLADEILKTINGDPK